MKGRRRHQEEEDEEDEEQAEEETNERSFKPIEMLLVIIKIYLS
jgi:hypothetical protein